MAGAETFWVTKTEVLHAKNAGTGSRLALVAVHGDDPESDELRYIVDPFRDFSADNFNLTGIEGSWAKEWERGGDPV